MTRKQIRVFIDTHGAAIEAFFSSHPKVAEWGAAGFDDVVIGYKTAHSVKRISGRLILSGEEIDRFESSDGSVILKGAPALSLDLLAAQIKGLLVDNEQASRYCEQVSNTLLDEGSCIFNAPFGLHMKDKEYEERYYDKKWQSAWTIALKSEFQAKEVTADENAGIGCFRLRAI